MSLHQVVGPLCRLLEQEGIGYAVIGAYAVAAWGVVRATQDIDLLIEKSDVETLMAALQRVPFTFDHRKGDRDDPIEQVIRIQPASKEAIDEVEIIAGIRDAPANITGRSRPVKLEDLTIQVACPEDMIILKLLAGSPLDIEDAVGILRLQKNRLDLQLLRQTAPSHLQQRLQELLSKTHIP